MAAATVTEISVEEFPTDLASGTRKRRARVMFRGPAASAGKTLDLATYVPGVADIEGILYETDSDVESGTASTWSTTTLTLGAGSASYEGCYSVTFT